MKLPILISYFSLLALGAFACSDDDTTTTPVATDAGSGDTSTASDGGATDSSTATDAVVDTGAAPGCTDAELEAPGANFTAGDAGDGGMPTITFPTGGGAAQYGNRCVKIKVGQQVAFQGAFESHPLEAFGGTTPSPIPALTNTTPGGGALVVTFSAAGTFGFRCDFHPFTMFGAVKVVP